MFYSAIAGAAVAMTTLFGMAAVEPGAPVKAAIVGPQVDNVVISEFMAANSSGRKDDDGEFSDWIEIHNAGQGAVSLAGWHISDDPSNLGQWPFPDVVVPGQGFLIVFASGKDRRDPQAQLHANFKLDRDGEYLGLIRPDGIAATQFIPAYPRQLSDISYGRSMTAETERFVPFESAARLLAPRDEGLDQVWTQPEFADAAWAGAAMAAGYDRPQPGEPEPAAPLEDVTQPGDLIVATSPNSPTNEEVDKAIDNNPQTKYLNFDTLNAGLTVTPSAGPSVVAGLRFTSANDAVERDPTSFLLLGSNDGTAFTEVASGPIADFTGRFVTVETVFSNSTAYAQYRLLFPTVRDAASSVAVQIAEVEFLASAGPIPSSFADLIETDVEDLMFGKSTSLYARFPFSVQQTGPFERMALRVRYDDGFVAYLNGVEVARANAPTSAGYDSMAVTNRARTEAVQGERFDLSPFAFLLRAGANVLAIQGLNDSSNSPDFLLQAELANTEMSWGENGYFDPPTPGSPNGQGRRGLTADVDAHPGRGFHETPINVVLSCPTAGAAIFYTTDGTEPTPTNGTEYAGPIRVDRTTTLRAIGTAEGWQPSPCATHTYLFLDDVVTQTRATTLDAGFPATWNGQAADYGLDPRVAGPAGQDNYGGKYSASMKSDLQSIPSMSIVMDVDDLFGAQGIYSNPLNRGEAWERAASVELIYPNGQEGFQAGAGIRIQGGAFRRFDLTLKKSFRIVFREKYGRGTLRYPLFGQDAPEEFDNFVLRANSNDAWPYWGGSALYVRDAFAMESAREMGMVASHTRFVHLYLNGVYWGLYNPVERPDAAFSATYHGGEKGTWDAINQDSVPDGNYDAWNRLLELSSMGLADAAAYQRIQGNNPDGVRNPNFEDLLDVENMIDYMILNFFVGNTDWPGRNWWAGRNRDQGDGFQFYPWDTETALGITGLDADRTGVSDAVARPYAAARQNADFRMHFADRVYRHFHHGGAFDVNPASPSWDPARPEDNRPAARFSMLADQIDRAIVGESARWGDQLSTGPFTRDEHWQRERDNLLSNYFPQRSAVVLEQFRRGGLYPRVEAPQMNQRGGRVAPGFELTLGAAEGTIFYTIDGSDPRTPVTVREVSRVTLVGGSAAKRALVPSSANGGAQLGTQWQGGQEPFEDASWTSGSGAVGYDQEATYRPHIQLDVQNAMENKNSSVFIRIPFDYDGAGQKQLNFMALRAQYDDGFVAYLNGRQIASANAPSALQWNSTATGLNSDSAAVTFEEFKADDGLSALKQGLNVLAIQGLNVSVSSSDFLIGVELIVGERLISSSPIQAIEYAGPIPLHDLTTIKARVLSGAEWSALNEATFETGTPALTVSELHYHPANPSESERQAGYSDPNAFEFIELFNHGTGTCDLTGLRFVTGVDFDFAGSPITTLGPGEYVVVVKNRAAFEFRYGLGLPIAGEYTGQLNNAGELVELVNDQDLAVLTFVYGTEAPWAEAADGAGPSLQLRDAAGDLNSAANWEASLGAGGSPGKPESVLALRLEVTAVDAGQLRFRFPARAGAGYTIHACDSLVTGAWEVVERAEPAAQDRMIQVDVDLSATANARFFRVSAP